VWVPVGRLRIPSLKQEANTCGAEGQLELCQFSCLRGESGSKRLNPRVIALEERARLRVEPSLSVDETGPSRGITHVDERFASLRPGTPIQATPVSMCHEVALAVVLLRYPATLHEFLPHQPFIVVLRPTLAITGNAELGFDSGEGA